MSLFSLKVIIKKLWLDYSLEKAILDARPQHSFSPAYIRNEKSDYRLTPEMVSGLEGYNHVIKNSSLNAIIQGIFVEDGKIFAQSDPRKEGVAAGY